MHCVVQLLWLRDFLDDDSSHRVVPGIRVRTAFETETISDHQTHANGAFTNPLTVPPDLTVLVYVGVGFAMIEKESINRFDSDWI